MNIAETAQRTGNSGRNSQFAEFPRIRKAGESDFDSIMAMCQVMFEENGIGPSMDEDLVASEVRAGLRGESSRIIVVIGDDRLEGSVFLIPGRSWYAQYWWLEDRWNFVL